MNAAEYLRLLRERWRIVVICVGVFVFLGLAITVITPRQYRADAQVFVTASAPTGTAGAVALAETYVQTRVQSYPTIATSPLVTKPVIDKLGLSDTPADLGKRITATAPTGTVLMTVSAVAKDPEEAARLADAVANQFATAIQDVERTPDATDSRVKVTVTRKAQVPTAPISPRPLVNLVAALVLGVIVGIVAAILRGMLDNRVRSTDMLEKLAGAPVLAVIPRDRDAPAHPLVIESGSGGPRAEAYRQLRTNLRYVSVDDPPRIIAVTSAMPSEGKTTTALNLGAALAETGLDVRVLESDLRQPSLATDLGLVGEVGLTTALVGATSVEDAVQAVDGRLGVLTSGSLPPNPSEVLRSAQLQTVIDDLSAKAQYVIIDTAPLLPVTDGAEVAHVADATLLVVRAGRTTHKQVTAAVDALAIVGVRPVGVVLNGARTR